MTRYNFFFASLLSSSALFLSSGVHAQGSCGEQPVRPEIVDGSTAAMEELVENSKEVKSYIAEADQYLDCEEEVVKNSDQLSEESRTKRTDRIKRLIASRNEVGDEFNAQVAKFREANPE